MLPSALACMNSMDRGVLSFAFTQTFWLDLFVWTAGGVFLNLVVLANVRAGADEQQPSSFRRLFFLAVAAAVVVLLAAITAGGPLLSVSPEQLARCTANLTMLGVLVGGPALLFSGQAAVFQGLWRSQFSERKRAGLVALVFTSVLLVLLMTVTRDIVVLPQLCEGSPEMRFIFLEENSGY